MEPSFRSHPAQFKSPGPWKALELATPAPGQQVHLEGDCQRLHRCRSCLSTKRSGVLPDGQSPCWWKPLCVPPGPPEIPGCKVQQRQVRRQTWPTERQDAGSEVVSIYCWWGKSSRISTVWCRSRGALRQGSPNNAPEIAYSNGASTKSCWAQSLEKRCCPYWLLFSHSRPSGASGHQPFGGKERTTKCEETDWKTVAKLTARRNGTTVPSPWGHGGNSARGQAAVC